MKLQVESLNVFLKSITQNAMPCWARVWECNYDQFECCGRPFWISLIQRRWVPRTRRAHKRTSSVFVLMGRLSTDETGACCVKASPLGSFNTIEVAGWNKTNFPLLTVSKYKVVWIILWPAIKYGVLPAELVLTHQKTLNSVTVSLQMTNPLFLEPPLPSCDSVFNFLYHSPALFFSFVRQVCLQQLSLPLSWGRDPTPRVRRSLHFTARVLHSGWTVCRTRHTTPLPLSDHWPGRHIWFIDLKGENKSGWGLICFRALIIMGTLRKEGDGWGWCVSKPLFIKWTSEHDLWVQKSTRLTCFVPSKNRISLYGALPYIILFKVTLYTSLKILQI